MSDNLSPEEKELYGIDQPYLSPADWALPKIRYLKGVVNSTLGSVASAVLTDNKQEGATAAVPGIAAYTYGLANLIGKGLQYLGNVDPTTGAPDKEAQIYDLPGAKTAEEITANARARGRELLVPTPTTPDEKAGQDFGINLWTGGPPLAGAVRAAPSAVQSLLKWVAPSMAMPKTHLAFSGGVEAAFGPTTPPTPDPIAQATSTEPPPAPPAPAEPEKYPVAPNGVPLPPPAPPPVVAEPPPQPLVPKVEYDPTTGQPVPITEGGSSSWTNGEMLAAGLGTIALAVGARNAASWLRTRQLAEHTATSAGFNARVASGMPAPTARGPIPGVTVTDRVAASTTDANVPLQQYARATAATPQAGEAAADAVALAKNDSVFTARLQSFANTGYDPISGYRMPAVVKHWESVNALPAPKQQQYDLARKAADELENRAKMGGQPRGYANQTTPDLQHTVAQARQDPEIARLLDESALHYDKMTEFMRARGLLTTSQMHLLQRSHRTFLPSSDAAGVIDNPLTARVMTPNAGLSQSTTPAWELDKQHFEAIFRAAEHNDLVLTLVKPALAFQRRTPGAAKLFEEIPAKTSDYVIQYRDAGTMKYVKVNAPELHAWIEGGPMQLSTFGHGMSMMRQTLQSGALGPINALFGAITAPKLGIYNGVVSSITRPAGTSFGLIDNALQGAGFKPGLPGDLTGVALGQPYAVAADALALGAKRASALLEPGASPISTALRNIFGDASINTVMNNLERRWINSVQYERQAVGNIGSSGQASRELPSTQIGASRYKTSALNNTVPELFRTTNPVVGGVTIPIGRAMPAFIRVNEMMHAAHRLVTESATSHFYRMNRTSVPVNRLNREARRLTGDIGEKGSGKVAQATANYIPWGNTMVQGTRRMANVAADNPMQMAAGIATAVGVPVIGSILLAVSRGPEYVEHLKNALEAGDGSSKVIFHNGQTPDEYSHFVMPQELRAPYALFMSMAFDLLAAPADPETKRMSLAGMVDFMQKHVSTANMSRIVQGVTSSVTPALPPIVSGTLAAAGQRVPMDYLARAVEGKPLMTNIHGQSSTPNVDKDIDPLTETAVGGVFKDILGAITGQVATNTYNTLNGFKEATNWTNDKGYAMLNTLDNIGNRAQSSVPFMNNTVWQQTIPRTLSNPMTDRVVAKRAALSQVTGLTSDVRNEGYTGTRGLSIPTSPEAAKELPTDPQMFGLYAILAKLNTHVAAQMKPADDIRKQIDAARHGAYDPKTQAQIVNTLNQKYQSVVQGVDKQITLFEGQLSQMLGKRVEVDKIDWKKGVEQFTTPNVE